MLELICDQAYTWEGVPNDRSPYNNHGKAFDTEGAFDGIEPGSGIIKFPNPDSRVRISNNDSWNRLISLKIDVVAKVDPHASRISILVEGYYSFSFRITEGALEGWFYNPNSDFVYVRSADEYAPDHMYHSVPDNKWTKLGFYHDGYAKFRLFIDDDLVGEANIEGSIPPVGSKGLAIGNSVDFDNKQFPGEIDSVQIWRLDPKAIKREFLGRPIPSDAIQCWINLVQGIDIFMKEHPDLLKSFAQKVNDQRYSFIRSLYKLPDSDQAKVRAALYDYVDLWLAGKIDGPEMRQALCNWFTILIAAGIDPLNIPGQQELLSLLKQVNVNTSDLLDCDSALAGFLSLLRDAADSCAQNKTGR